MILLFFFFFPFVLFLHHEPYEASFHHEKHLTLNVFTIFLPQGVKTVIHDFIWSVSCYFKIYTYAYNFVYSLLNRADWLYSVLPFVCSIYTFMPARGDLILSLSYHIYTFPLYFLLLSSPCFSFCSSFLLTTQTIIVINSLLYLN